MADHQLPDHVEQELRAAGSLTRRGDHRFSSLRDGNLQIYVVNADGSNPIRLTDDPHYDDFPVWSPDGQFIAYQKHRQAGNGTSIWVMRADGTDPYELVSNGYGPPVWQPTGVSRTAIEATVWGLLKANWR